MSALDIIPLPGQPGKWGRRVLVEAWIEAGSPPVNDGGAGRLYGLQKYFWDGWADRLPGFNPADNPDDESQRLAHVRFGALDITPTPERVRRLEAAGLIRPYDYEPWHFELPNIRKYSIVRSLPAAATGSNTYQKGLDMAEAIISAPNGKVVHLRSGGKTDFESVKDYNTFRDQVAFLRDAGATDLMPLPPLDKVPKVSWDTFTFLCGYFGAPTK
ncbi:hypothetical protein NS234_07425 [Microbacterium oxydans]|uniref:Lrp/AsnC family transcriptional regulator n=1 Tax=Microbacterium oxydans TaxID=82380 RepID=UPI0007348796|nr:Lrp/AsnC family transcriptional regulator [Microbacterium oxydans]KTR77427.1 hypothetical protein NS234_07425 [Microbacterium oxydans]